MSKQQTAVDWLVQQYIDGNYSIEVYEQAKQMERENASTFGIRVTSECCSLKNGKIEVDLHKFETLLNEMYGTENSD